jgi:ubiquinone/menaquinone biosynthesis C-methylase UbiE
MSIRVEFASSKQQASAANTPDFAAIKQRQQATWASGDFAVIGVTLQIVGESLAEATDIRAGERVIDVAAGNGNATLAAARRLLQRAALPKSLQPITYLHCSTKVVHALQQTGCK